MSRSPFLVLLSLGAFSALPAAGQVEGGGLDGEEDPAALYRRWAGELGASDYQVREEAYRKLWQAGRPALPFVEEAARSDDLETRDRAERLLPLLRWSITPELVERAGSDLLRYCEGATAEKVQILQLVRERAPEIGLPFFRAVLEAETDSLAWEESRKICEELAGRELVGWLEAMAQGGRAEGQVFRYLGERYARMRPEEIPAEKLASFTDAILAREGGFDLPEVYSNWMCALVAAGKEDLADKVYEAGLAAFAGSSGYRLEIARRMLDLDRADRALAVVSGQLETPEGIPGIVELLVQHRYVDRAWEAARSALERFPGNEALANGVYEVFFKNLEFGRALSVAETRQTQNRTSLALLYRYTLAWEKGVAQKKEAFEAAKAAAPDDPTGWSHLFAELVKEHLYHGLGDEALALCLEHEKAFDGAEAWPAHAFMAAVAAGDLDRATALQGKAAAFAWDPEDTSLARARLALALAVGTKEEILSALDGTILRGNEIDLLLAAYAATGERAVFERRALAPGLVSSRFDSGFAEGQISEREGRPGEALFRYAKALAEIGSEPNTRLFWHFHEVRRKVGYLSRVEGAFPAALAQADLLDEAGKARVKGEIHRLTGDWAAAAAEYEKLLTDASPPEDRLDAAWARIETGDRERALALLEPVRALGREEGWGRAALLFERLAAEQAGDAARIAELDEILYDAPIVHKSVYEAGFYFTSRGLYGPGRSEWEAILASHEPGDNYPFYHSNAWEYFTYILAAEGGEPERAADYFLRGLQACWVNGYTIIEKGGEPFYRAQIELWHARASLSAGNREAAVRSLRQAIGLDPYHVEAARELALLVREKDPALAARADRLATSELQRRTIAEPTNPDAHYELGLALAASGDREAALRSAKRAAGMAGEDERYRALVLRLEEGE
ncbi:MAG: hypothetical protein HY720_32535 [Planctomycetes bacterium]|nr:hypothetical protein [Planctomycetota bacterium]